MSDNRFASLDHVEILLRNSGYLVDRSIASAVFLADRLKKPILAEGPAGTGKTELAKALARATNSRLIRLQCYEGLDESKALYEWDYRKQLLRIQTASRENSGRENSGRDDTWNALHDDLFGEEFLLTRPLLEAIRAKDPVVLLIDEVDRVEVEAEALFLEILSEFQVSIPELGTLCASQIPLVVLTSNNTRELSEALKRRCLYLHIDYPSIEREKAIVQARTPDLAPALAQKVAEVIAWLRTLDVRKQPSISETLDWARAIVVWGADGIDDERLLADLPVLLKYQPDIDKAAGALHSGAAHRSGLFRATP